MDPVTILFLAMVNFIAMFFASVTGGANLVMTPLTVSLGLPPANAIASTRFGTLGPNMTSLREFHKGKKVIWNYAMPFILISIIASSIAASIVPLFEQLFLQRFMGLVILIVLAFTIVNRRLGLEERKFRHSRKKELLGYSALFFSVLIFILIGGGGGILVSYVLIFFFGMTYLQSSGTRKVGNLFANITASIVFLLTGLVVMEVMVPLFISGALGGYLGPRYAIRKGEEWVRNLFVVVIFLLALRLLVF